MKRNKILLVVALLMTITLTTGCSSNDAAIETPIEQTAKTGEMLFTATIAPKAAQTRSVNESGVTTWVVNEQIALYYQKTNNSYGTATANVDAVNGGVATISATLSDAKDVGTVKFVYPATLANATGDDIDATKLATQHGTIADISANFDAATATATLATNGTTCGTTATVSFTNRVLIGKFTPKYGGTAIDGITTLTINDGTRTYTVTPVGSDPFDNQGIYVAMLPVSSQTVSLTATTASENYFYPGKSISLTAGKLYNNLTIDMSKHVNLALLTSDCTLYNGDVVSGTLNAATYPVKISIAAGATVTLDGVTISGTNVNDDAHKHAGITCLGNATIILADGTTNIVKGFHENYSGIQPAYNTSGDEYTLTIQGTGTLNASTNSISASSGAGIGGGLETKCGNITISGGTVNATGGPNAAGIGSGTDGTCGTITISGGTIEAQGGSDTTYGGAGIGSGYNGASCNIIINSGTVTATGGKGSAGIGGYHSQADLIEITTGVTSVTASKGTGAPTCIGRSNAGNATGKIIIGGTVWYNNNDYTDSTYGTKLQQNSYTYPEGT